MKILKHGIPNRIITCNCGCEFEFEISDVKEEMLNSDKLFMFKCVKYVICPDCGAKNTIEQETKFVY